ncbi:MAG TPA: hypothetical protein VD973_21390 [Symbiobacteriaceae bacterium]|jgi:hypothetical protein|nr:hypothetical protein [Symbiobacteriaceae bacterium]
MVNLFRPGPAQQGSLTAALLALLEHSDKALLNGLLERAGIPLHARPDTPLTIRFPVPDGPPDAGLISGPDFQVTITAQVPGEPWDPAAALDLPGVPLAISLAGKAPPGAHGLSWEQVDRWLAAEADTYDPESRTGFLIEQFRAVLPELGIAYFAGFEAPLLAAAPEALATLSQFYQVAGQLFERLAPSVAGLRPGAAQVRQSRPEELLAGYCYRDYSDPALGAAGFLRVALNLPEARMEAACWLMPGEAHGRLRERLTGEPAFRAALARLTEQPLLWLWSPNNEQKLPLDSFDPESVEGLAWGEYQAGILVTLPFADFPAEDLTGRVLALLEALTTTLQPVVGGGVVH